MSDVRDSYEIRLEEGNQRACCYSTFELVRALKGLPEWAGLSVHQAHNAVAIGLAKIRRHGGDPWMLLPDNEVKQISAEDDFPDTWNAVRSGKIDRSDYLKQALEQAKRSPIKWSKELEAKLAPASASFKLFCDVCIYLQGMVGADGYILLPQVQLAELIGTAQGGISTYCVRAERAGLLRRVDPNWSWKKRKAIKWQCTATWQRTKA